MTFNKEESEAFLELERRVNENAARLEAIEASGRSIYDALPRWIKDRITEWPFPIYRMPLRLIWDSTPKMVEGWEDDSNANTNRFVKGYRKRRSDDSPAEFPDAQ